MFINFLKNFSLIKLVLLLVLMLDLVSIGYVGPSSTLNVDLVVFNKTAPLVPHLCHVNQIARL
jgi:hypothetical protein